MSDEISWLLSCPYCAKTHARGAFIINNREARLVKKKCSRCGKKFTVEWNATFTVKEVKE